MEVDKSALSYGTSRKVIFNYQIHPFIIASASEDSTIRRWNADTGESIGNPITGLTSPIKKLLFMKNQNTIVSLSKDSKVLLWDTVTGERTHSSINITGLSTVNDIALNGNDDIILARSNGLELFESANNYANCKSLISDHHFVCVYAKNDIIITASNNNTIQRWSAITANPIGDPLQGHQDKITSILISEDQTFIISASLDSTIRRWDLKTGDEIGNPLRGHTHAITCIAMNSKADTIVSGSHDHSIRRWDTLSGKQIGNPIYGHSRRISTLVLSEEDIIISASFDYTIRRWSARTGKSIGEPLQGHNGYVNSVAINSKTST